MVQIQIHNYLSGCKSSKDISEIFCSTGCKNSRPSVFLIEGAPGIGKTILVKEITFRWAKSELLTETKLLFLHVIYLRDPQLSHITTLEQFICYTMHLSTKSKLMEAIQQNIESTSGEHCTIIFDGYDEMSEEKRSKSFISDIISRKVLQLSSLVITSRPTASAGLHAFVDRRVEILGFAKEDRIKYIQQSLEENKKDIKYIEEFLENNPFIDSLCYIPLNMTILICLFKSSLESGTELPKTQTEINHQFAIVTIVRYLKKEKCLTLDSLLSLPSPYKQKLKNLSKMALVFLGKDKLVFNDEEIRKNCPECEGKWDGFGLLKVVEHRSFFPVSSFTTYNFLHYSMQEFLAGFYISTLKDAKQIKLLQETFWKPRYLNVGIMYVGLTRGNSFALKHFLSGQRSIILSWLFGTKGIAQNTFGDKVKCLDLFQCFLEAGNDEIAQRVGNFLSDNTIDLSGYALLQKDIHSFGFFLTKSANKVRYKLNLSRCYIGDQGFEVLCRTICGQSENGIIIGTTNLAFNHLTSSSVHRIVNLINCLESKKLILSNNDIDYNLLDTALFNVCLTGNLVMNTHIEKVTGRVSCIYFSNNDFYSQQVIEQLCHSNYNCNLYFWNTNLQMNTFINLFLALSIEFDCISVYDEYLLCDKGMAKTTAQLQQLNFIINNIEYTIQSKCQLLAYGMDMAKLIEVFKNRLLLCDLEKNVSTDCVKKQWKWIDLYRCAVCDEGLQELVSCFQSNQPLYLEMFSISNCCLTEESVKSIHEILRCCIIKNMVISENFIPSKVLQGAILSDICTKSKILNFKHGIPLVILNDYDDNSVANVSEQSYSITKYFINCDVDDSLRATNNVESMSILYEIFLSNFKLKEELSKVLLFLCEYAHININIFQGHLTDEIANEIVDVLQKHLKAYCSYVLTSDSKIVAFEATQLQIAEGLNSNSNISVLEFVNCELHVSSFDLLKNLLSDSSRKWTAINLSGCNIKD